MLIFYKCYFFNIMSIKICKIWKNHKIFFCASNFERYILYSLSIHKVCAIFVTVFFRCFFVNLFLSENDKNKKIKTLILKGLRGYPLTHDFTCKV